MNFKDFLEKEETADKTHNIRNLLDGQGLILFFATDSSLFGAPEESRLVFAKLKDRKDKDLVDADFMALDLIKSLSGNLSQNIFTKKDLKNIKVIDREEAEKELVKHKVRKIGVKKKNDIGVIKIKENWNKKYELCQKIKEKFFNQFGVQLQIEPTMFNDNYIVRFDKHDFVDTNVLPAQIITEWLEDEGATIVIQETNMLIIKFPLVKESVDSLATLKALFKQEFGSRLDIITLPLGRFEGQHLASSNISGQESISELAMSDWLEEHGAEIQDRGPNWVRFTIGFNHV